MAYLRYLLIVFAVGVLSILIVASMLFCSVTSTVHGSLNVHFFTINHSNVAPLSNRTSSSNGIGLPLNDRTMLRLLHIPKPTSATLATAKNNIIHKSMKLSLPVEVVSSPLKPSSISCDNGERLLEAMKNGNYLCASHYWKSNETCIVDSTPVSDHDVCNMLIKHYGGTMYFVGDSLVRQLFQGLLILVTGDEEFGSLKSEIPLNERSRCAGHEQFHPTCRMYTNTDKYLCDGKVHLVYKEFYKMELRRKAWDLMKIFNPEHDFLVVGVGLHMDLQAKKVWNEYAKPMMLRFNSTNISTRKDNIWPILWATVHATGRKKKKEYLRTQAREQVSAFNVHLCKKLGEFSAHRIRCFDTFNLIASSEDQCGHESDEFQSFDGTHVGRLLNALKATLLIKYIGLMGIDK